MILASSYKGKRVGVFGLARTGLASCRALEAAGAAVLAWDDHADRRAPVTDLAQDLYATDFATLDALLLAPGVPLTHPEPHALVKKARAAGTPIIGDGDVFQAARGTLPAHSLVAITGTNGKSTSTALMAHVLAHAGRPAVAAGNIGVPVLSLAPLDAGGVYVFEMSSFQIDLTRDLAPDVAVLLNISPDHLDRHGDMDGYVRAKARLFELLAPQGRAIVGVDDPYARQVADDLGDRAVRISTTGPQTGGVGVDENGRLWDGLDGTPGAICDLSHTPALAGRHNWQNAAAVYAAARTLGLDGATVAQGLASFAGLAHRMEPLGRRGDVLYVNDSKATNAEAATRALAAFDRIHWIAGGRPKDSDYTALAEAAQGRVRHAYLIGEAASRLSRALEGGVPHTRHPDLTAAVQAAASKARPGEVVLLSPACASFDQYPDFEARGDAFRAAVDALTEAPS